MRITTLIENTTDFAGNLTNEHGLSMLIETGKLHILFDTGQSAAFINNAEKLGIDLTKLDYVIISHAHYDHSGGLCDLLAKYNNHYKVVVGKNFFTNSRKYRNLGKVSGGDFVYKYNGIDFAENDVLKYDVSINYVDSDMTKLSSNVYVFANFPRKYKFEEENSNLVVKKDNKYIIDKFSDEIALGIKMSKGLLLFIGCAHPGFLNMVAAAQRLTGEKIFGIIGGTHLVEADRNRIENSIKVIKKLDVQFLGLSHCTGNQALKRVKEEFPQLFENRTGSVINF